MGLKMNPGGLVRRIPIYLPAIIGLGVIAVFIYLSHRQGVRNSAESYLRSGISHAASRDYDHALADYNEAVRFDPTYVDAYFNRGQIHGMLQNVDAAIVDFSAVIRLNPKHVGAFVERGNAYGAKQDFEQALADFHEA